MAFTYSDGGTTTLNRLRLEIGDVDETRPLFTDGELNDFIAQDTSVLASAAHACETLAVRYSRDFDFSADGSSFRKSTVADMYRQMAKRLRARATGTTTSMPTRKDGYSDDIASDEVST